jgi:hypothetical protein
VTKPDQPPVKDTVVPAGDDLAVQISLYSTGRSSSPTSHDKATKAEVHYRPAHIDMIEHPIPKPTYQSQFKVGIIPVGQPSTEADGTTRRAVTAHRQECGTCVHFGFGRCTIVAGKIDRDMVCNLWRGPQ